MMKMGETPFNCCESDEEIDSDDSEDMSSIVEVKGLAPKPPGPPAKARIAYLDHIKLICMTSVWWIHGLAYACHYCRFPEDTEAWPDEPTWYPTLIKMLHKYNMSLFAFCSGSVSYAEATPDRVANSFTSLILPCVLFQLWVQFTWYGPATGKWSNTFGFMTNSEPWYMKTLFAWRILLFSFGQFSDIALAQAAVVTRIVWQVSGQPNDNLLSHIVNDAPFFVAGHILVRRRRLLEPYVEFLRKRTWLQVACFIGYACLWADVVLTGVWPFDKLLLGKDASLFNEFDNWFFGLFPDTLFCKTLKDVFRIIEVFTYGFVATGWLPTSEMPVFSSTGKYTLYAYLCNYHGIIAFLSLWKFIMPRASVGFWWASWLAVLPLFTMLLCSEPVRFILWPVCQPSWFGKDWRTTTIDQVADVEWVKKVGFVKWAAIVVAVHGVWITWMLTKGLPWSDQCEVRVPAW